jgi:hypothetical protein
MMINPETTTEAIHNIITINRTFNSPFFTLVIVVFANEKIHVFIFALSAILAQAVKVGTTVSAFACITTGVIAITTIISISICTIVSNDCKDLPGKVSNPTIQYRS